MLPSKRCILLAFGVLASTICTAQQQTQSSPSNTAAAASEATPTTNSATPTSMSTITSVLTTTLSSGQSLPTSITASASHNGSVWYLPVPTVINVATNSTTTSMAASPTTPTSKTTESLPLHTVIDPAFGVLGVILILSGLPMAFYGHRNRWSSYFLSGFFALALICISIILKVGVLPAVNPPSKGIRGLFLVAAVIAGAIGAILSIVFWRGAGLLACGLGGFFFGLFLQAMRAGGLIHPIGIRFVLYTSLYALFFAASCFEKIHHVVLTLSTAIVGATAIALGIDCFSSQGLKEFYIRNLGFDALFSEKYYPTFENGHFPLVQGMQIELGVLGALILMGAAFQIRLWSDLRSQLTVLKRSDERRNMRSKAESAAKAIARTAKRELAEWEARHGYKKTAGRNADLDEESRPGVSPSEAKPTHSRNSSFMTLLRSPSDTAQLTTPGSSNEKVESPAVSSILSGTAYPFPSQSTGRRSSQFLDYIQRGPERTGSTDLTLNLPAPILMVEEKNRHRSLSSTSMPGQAMQDLEGAQSRLEPNNAAQNLQMQVSDVVRNSITMGQSHEQLDFRQRSASTAALMSNSAGFFDLPPEEPTQPTSVRETEPSLLRRDSSMGDLETTETVTEGSKAVLPGATTAPPSSAVAAIGSTFGHERTSWTPPAYPTVSPPTSVFMSKRYSHQGKLQTSYTWNVRPREGFQRSSPQSLLPASTAGVRRASLDGGTSTAYLAARRSLAMRREERQPVPWTYTGAEANKASRGAEDSTDVSPRLRAMSVEELEARHRAKLTALQRPATQTVQEAEALRRAKEEWERKRQWERRRMLEREGYKKATAAGAGAASGSRVSSDFQQAPGNTSKDDRRRSRALSATLLEAVGEEGRDLSRADRAAEWRRSVVSVAQVDPSATQMSTPTSPIEVQPNLLSEAAPMASANPFPIQQRINQKRLSDTDRRRLNQGAADRHSRRTSLPLLDFHLPTS